MSDVNETGLDPTPMVAPSLLGPVLGGLAIFIFLVSLVSVFGPKDLNLYVNSSSLKLVPWRS